MTTFYDSAVALLAGKKLDKSEADRVIALINERTVKPELEELQALRRRLESAVSDFDNVRSSINSLSYDFNQLDRDADSAFAELEYVSEAVDTLAEAINEGK